MTFGRGVGACLGVGLSGNIGGERGFRGGVVATAFQVGDGEVAGDVVHSLVSGCLGVPLVDRLCENARVSENLDEVPHVCSVRDGVFACGGETAALAAPNEDGFDGGCGIVGRTL